MSSKPGQARLETFSTHHNSFDMNEKIVALIDPEMKEGIKLLPPQLIPQLINETAEQNYLSVRELVKQMEALPFESPTISMEEKVVQAEGREIRLYLYRPKDMSQHSGICLYWIHGGGNITGSAREDGVAMLFVESLKCTMVSVDYKLAPEHQHPEGMEDCYAGLVWTAQHAEELGIDANKIAIGGGSAGGGMTARTVLLNRERQGVNIAYQLLQAPMIDNTHDTPSGRESGYLVWDRVDSFFGWRAYLGENPGKEATPLQSPSRATDLSGLPPTLVYASAVELFRDEAIAYAQQLMRDGVPTELYVAPGVPHGGEGFVPTARVSQTINHLFVDALKRAFSIN
jgi:acetyl esterase/lipase